jgi:hypothetical protein
VKNDRRAAVVSILSILKPALGKRLLNRSSAKGKGYLIHREVQYRRKGASMATKTLQNWTD